MHLTKLSIITKKKKQKNSRTKPSSNCYHKSETNDMESMLHLNPVKYLTNASPLHILLSALDHTLVKKTAWRPPKTCRPIIQSLKLVEIHYIHSNGKSYNKSVYLNKSYNNQLQSFTCYLSRIHNL
jgi:hypothetical protein